MVTTHPKLVTLGIGLAITFVIGTVIGMVDHQTFALNVSHENNNDEKLG